MSDKEPEVFAEQDMGLAGTLGKTVKSVIRHGAHAKARAERQGSRQGVRKWDCVVR